MTEDDRRPKPANPKPDFANEYGLYLVVKGTIGPQFEVEGTIPQLREFYRHYKRMGLTVALASHKGNVTHRDIDLIISPDDKWRLR